MTRRYSSRWGRFRVSGELICAINGAGTDSEAFKRVVVLMREILVVRAQHCPASDEIEYMGISPLFDELAEGEEIPEYLLEGQTIEHKAVCMSCKNFGPQSDCPRCGGELEYVERREYAVKAFKRV